MINICSNARSLLKNKTLPYRELQNERFRVETTNKIG